MHKMYEELPSVMEVRQEVLSFTEGLAYAGRHLHEECVLQHTHTFVEIAFVIGGTATHQCRAGRQELRAGDVALLRPGVWHGYENCRDLELYNCCFSSALLRRELSWTKEDQLLGYLLWNGPYSAHGHGMLTFSLTPRAFEECMVQLHALAALRSQPVEHYRGAILGRLSLLLNELGRALHTTSALPRAGGPPHPAVSRAMLMLESNIARQWTLGDLARDLHLAPDYLRRLFKAATGLAPMAYLAQLRAEHAAVLLLHSGEPITSISRTVGWPDQNYFARRFKAHYGLSASAYRTRFATGAVHLATSPQPPGD